MNAKDITNGLLIDFGVMLRDTGKDALKSFTHDERQLAIAVLADAGQLEARAALGQPVTGELALVESSLLDFKSAASTIAAQALANVLRNSLKFAGNALTGILSKLGL